MGFFDAVKDFFHTLFVLGVKGLFIFWLSVVIAADILIFLYHLFVSVDVFPPLALITVQLLSFVPFILLIFFIGGKRRVRLRDPADEARKRRNYDPLESRARI